MSDFFFSEEQTPSSFSSPFPPFSFSNPNPNPNPNPSSTPSAFGFGAPSTSFGLNSSASTGSPLFPTPLSTGSSLFGTPLSTGSSLFGTPLSTASSTPFGGSSLFGASSSGPVSTGTNLFRSTSSASVSAPASTLFGSSASTASTTASTMFGGSAFGSVSTATSSLFGVTRGVALPKRGVELAGQVRVEEETEDTNLIGVEGECQNTSGTNVVQSPTEVNLAWLKENNGPSTASLGAAGVDNASVGGGLRLGQKDENINVRVRVLLSIEDTYNNSMMEEWKGMQISREFVPLLDKILRDREGLADLIDAKHLFFRRAMYESLGRSLQIFRYVLLGHGTEALLEEAGVSINSLGGLGMDTQWLHQRLDAARDVVTRRLDLEARVEALDDEIDVLKKKLKELEAEHSEIMHQMTQLDFKSDLLVVYR